MQQVLKLAEHAVEVRAFPEDLAAAGADEEFGDSGQEAWRHCLQLDHGAAREAQRPRVQGALGGPAAARGKARVLGVPPAVVGRQWLVVVVPDLLAGGSLLRHQALDGDTGEGLLSIREWLQNHL